MKELFLSACHSMLVVNFSWATFEVKRDSSKDPETWEMSCFKRINKPQRPLVYLVYKNRFREVMHKKCMF